MLESCFFFFFQAEDGIRDATVTGFQTCALPISSVDRRRPIAHPWRAATADRREAARSTDRGSRPPDRERERHLRLFVLVGVLRAVLERAAFANRPRGIRRHRRGHCRPERSRRRIPLGRLANAARSRTARRT